VWQARGAHRAVIGLAEIPAGEFRRDLNIRKDSIFDKSPTGVRCSVPPATDIALDPALHLAHYPMLCPISMGRFGC
jgi:hypothetical protein